MKNEQRKNESFQKKIWSSKIQLSDLWNPKSYFSIVIGVSYSKLGRDQYLTEIAKNPPQISSIEQGSTYSHP